MGYFVRGKRCKDCSKSDYSTPKGRVQVLDADGYCPACAMRRMAEGHAPGQLAMWDLPRRQHTA